MAETRSAAPDSGGPMVYAIRIQGHLGRHWLASFGDATLTLEAGGDTLLTCTVADQAALHAILRKVRDLGLPLLAVTRLESPPPSSAT